MMSDPVLASSSQATSLDPYWQVRTGHCSFRRVDVSSFSKSTGVSKKAIIPLAPKSSLLDPCFNNSQTRHTSACGLLERMRDLAPLVALNYKLKPSKTVDVRLRFLRPDLRESHGPQDFGSFIALSYCWQTREPNATSSHLKRINAPSSLSSRQPPEELPFPVAPVIFKAVLDECQSADEGLWVDQLSINQEDEAEKKITISAMDAIYKSARIVVVAIQDIEVSEIEEAELRKYIPLYEEGKDSQSIDREIEKVIQQRLVPTLRSVPSSQRQTVMREFSRKYEQALRQGQSTELQRLVEAEEVSPQRAREIREEIQQDIPQLVETFSQLLDTATPNSSALRAFAQKILGSKWFTRAWCAHEAEMSDRHIFLIKCRSHPQRLLRFTGSFLLHLTTKYQNESSISKGRTDVDPDGYQLHLIRLQSKALGMAVGEDLNVPTWIRSCRFVLALNAGGSDKLKGLERVKNATKDKLSIVLNTLNTGLYYDGPGLTEDECYHHLTVVGLAARDPTALLTNGQHLCLAEDQRNLSWMQAPTQLDSVQVSKQLLQDKAIPRFPALNIALDPGKGCEWISLDLAFFRREGHENYAIHLLNSDSWWASLARYIIIAAWKLGFDPMDRKPGLPRRQRPTSRPREMLQDPLWRLFLETLTGCLIRGIPWVASLDIARQFPGLESSLEKLQDCQDRGGNPFELLGAIEDVMAFIFELVMAGIPDVQCVTQWTPYFIHTFGNYVKDRVVAYGPRKARAQIQVVVPVCLLSSDYKDFPRVWLVERSIGFSRGWDLLGKTRMVGDAAGLCSDAQNWQILKNERVYSSQESTEGRS